MSQVTAPILLDSTGQDISAKLQAIANAINGGTIDPLTVTQNGTYTPSGTTIGYGPVTVNVGGGAGLIDLSFLPNSVAADVLSSRGLQLPAGGGITSIVKNEKLYTDLSAANTDVTCYAAVRCASAGEGILLCVPYSNTNGNSPNFYTPYTGYSVDCTIYSSNTNIPGLSCDIIHVYALSINASTKKVRYFVDGAYIMEKTFNNSGACVVVGAGDKNASSYAGAGTDVSYFGVVADLESDATVIANMQVIMQNLGMS